MDSIESLVAQQEKFKNNLSFMKATHEELSKSISCLKEMIELQDSCYKVDDVGGGSNYLKYLLEKETNLDNSILNNSMPDMSRKINEYNDKINEAKNAKEKEAKANEIVTESVTPARAKGGILSGMFKR